MLGTSDDPEEGVMVWNHFAPYLPSDYMEHYESICSYAENWADRPTALGVLIANTGAPPPDAVHRRRMAKLVSSLPKGWSGAMVSPSALVRSTVVAMGWLRLTPFPLHAAPDIATLAEQLGRKNLDRLLARLASEAMRARRNRG